MTGIPLNDASGPTSESDFNFHAECYACPVGSFFHGARSAHPDGVSDVVEHMLMAAHEVLEVARVAIDTADAAIERQQNARRTSPPTNGTTTGPTTGASESDVPRTSTPRRVRRIEIV